MDWSQLSAAVPEDRVFKPVITKNHGSAAARPTISPIVQTTDMLTRRTLPALLVAALLLAPDAGAFAAYREAWLTNRQIEQAGAASLHGSSTQACGKYALRCGADTSSENRAAAHLRVHPALSDPIAGFASDYPHPIRSRQD